MHLTTGSRTWANSFFLLYRVCGLKFSFLIKKKNIFIYSTRYPYKTLNTAAFVIETSWVLLPRKYICNLKFCSTCTFLPKCLKNRKYIFVDTFPVNGHASPLLLFQGRVCRKKRQHNLQMKNYQQAFPQGMSADPSGFIHWRVDLGRHTQTDMFRNKSVNRQRTKINV